MVPVRLHRGFPKKFRQLPEQVQQDLLPTLKRLSEQPELEPQHREPNDYFGEIRFIYFDNRWLLAYAVQYAEAKAIITEAVRTPICIVATLAEIGEEHLVELTPLQ